MLRKNFRKKEQIALQSMILPAVITLFVFAYIPMYGITIAFKDFKITEGIFGSQWVGFKYFVEFLKDPNLWNVMRNTMILNILGTLICFPAPIILAVMLRQTMRLIFV